MISETKEWKSLISEATHRKQESLLSLFEKDSGRFEKLSYRIPGILVDLSKNALDKNILDQLINLAKASSLSQKRDDMFSGAPLNFTENRAVLHTALRTAENQLKPEIRDVLAQMSSFADKVRNGTWHGYNGKEITDIVNIGIGGSMLGTRLVIDALTPHHHPRLSVHFASNVEASELHHILQRINLDSTLFIIASKSFTTIETMQNAHVARTAVVRHFGTEEAIARHFVAASSNIKAVTAFGIAPENMFTFWDWVGGRFSSWSAIGLAIMLMTGPDIFKIWLSGAHEMDTHFRTAPFESNLPVLLGMAGIWYRNFLEYPAYAVSPYHSGLRYFAAWLQQIDMESNGKQAPIATGPLVFGEPGTDAQHSFFQWLHQGSDIVPVDFIAATKTPYGTPEQQNMLLANCLAQSESLMKGQTIPGEPHRFFPGNRPSTTIMLDELTPRTLGMLMALYEHKVFVQGAIWGINSFDQFGVELGKTMSVTIEKELNTSTTGPHDGSTLGLMKHIRSMK